MSRLTVAKIALVTPEGDVARSVSIPTEPRRAPKEFVGRVAAALRGWRYEGLGLGIAGGIDAETGTLTFSPNLKRWIGFPFKREFERRLKVRVVADNDANVAVWGGYVVGLGKKPRCVVGATLGTGVGGGLIIGGRLHRGAIGGAGEIGHQVIAAGGAPCHCGKRGCLEAYAGTYGIQRIARRLMGRPPSPLTPKALCDAARAGVPGSGRVWKEYGTWLGIGLANTVMILNPDAVILLGGVARAGELILEPVRRVFAAQPFREPFEALTLSMPPEREWGCVGAALLSRERR
jgi:glucokinase